MSTSEGTPQVHVAFVWHMHQPYYRSARTGAFQMPWARLHALKDYLDMVEILADYPTIHQTFNLVPSLVEQLEDYAGGSPIDIYWQNTVKPASALSPGERAFLVERMCERSDHPRAKSHPRYLELALKRESAACRGWEECSGVFSVDELRDLQIWFTLAWFDPTLLETDPLLSLVRRGRDFREEDKLALTQVQSRILARVIPAYRDAARRGQIELSTSPYFHPILPLLINSDSARVGAGDTVLPHRRFAHVVDAWEQVAAGVAKHEQVFGARPRGMWCSEQAVGEEVLPLLMNAGIGWTIAGETVLARSVAGSAAPPGSAGGLRGEGGDSGANDVNPSRAGRAVPSPYLPYRLRREEGEMAIVFRDHTLSDLIGFAYQSWDSRDAANDMLARIHAVGALFTSGRTRGSAGVPFARQDPGADVTVPLVTIALDGENAWEYYPHDGRDFLRYLYEGLAADPAIRCVTVSEHLDEHPAITPLDWLHTGSWIGGDVRTWSGDPGHNVAWDLLHDARDLAAARRSGSDDSGPVTYGEAGPGRVNSGDAGLGPAPARVVQLGAVASQGPSAADRAWHHILVAEGSDWFWWFGEHQHTDLDHVWDLEFRQHLQEVYALLGEPVPARLYLPVLGAPAGTSRPLPAAAIQPLIDGQLIGDEGWDAAGSLLPDHPSTMQRAGGMHIIEARFGWGPGHLFLLLIPRDSSELEGLEFEVTLTSLDAAESSLKMVLATDGRVATTGGEPQHTAKAVSAAWADVIEVALPVATSPLGADGRLGLMVRVGREGMIDQVFHSTGLAL